MSNPDDIKPQQIPAAEIRMSVLAQNVDALAERLLEALQMRYAHNVVTISVETARALLHRILQRRDGELRR
jgi:hypothetical protein